MEKVMFSAHTECQDPIVYSIFTFDSLKTGFYVQYLI